jgi:hypothetical protein
MFRFKSSINLSSDTQSLLESKNLSLSDHPLDILLFTLQNDSSSIAKMLSILYSVPDVFSFTKIGNTFISLRQSMPNSFSFFIIDMPASLSMKFPDPWPPIVPTTHGKIASAGIGDLIVVKQHLIGYERVDVAHIENILKGETRSMEFSNRRIIETTSIETEITSSEERV